MIRLSKVTTARLFMAFLAVVLITNIVVISRLVLQRRDGVKPRNDILTLTSPVYTIEGTVVSVEGAKLVVEVTRPPDTSQGTAAAFLRTRLEFNVPKSVQIYVPPRVVPYSFKQTQPNQKQERVSVEGLRAGTRVVVTSESDLRVAKDFTAASIQIIPQESYFVGFLKNNAGSRVQAEGSVISQDPAATVAQSRYTFAVTADTEIVKLRSLNGIEKAEKTAIDAIPSTTPITIYYDGNPESGSAAALLIRFSDSTPPASISRGSGADDIRVSSPSSTVPPPALPSP